VVRKPEEAPDCFLRTKVDVLVMGDWVVLRGERGSSLIQQATLTAIGLVCRLV